MVTWTVSFEQSFLFIILVEWDGREMGYIWKFYNVETPNKREVSLGSCLFKMHLSFRNIGLDPWADFYHGEFL